VYSRRSVIKGQMVVEIELTLESGEVVRMKTFYSPLPPSKQ